ncbi:YueI family protein [Halanaerobaculum tunisiense]
MGKEEDIQQEAIKNSQQKSDLEQTVAAKAQGGLELKKGEKNQFLGEYRERVLLALSFAQVEEDNIYPQVKTAIKDPEATKLIINRQVDSQAARDYIKLAQEADVSFKKIDSPDFIGKIALEVVSDHAVNKEDIFVESREDYLLEQGLPTELIAVQGEKICSDCYQLLQEKAPGEVDNYQQMSWLDKLLGVDCPGCD